MAGLARLIAKTMPEDDPGECVGEDAEKVAAYIYDVVLLQGRAGPQQVSAAADRALATDRAPVQERRRRPDRQLPRRRPTGTTSAGLKAEYSQQVRRRRGRQAVAAAH